MDDRARTEDDAAILVWEAAIAINSADEAPYRSIARIYERQGRYEDAFATYKRLMQVLAKDADDVNAIFRAFWDLQDPDSQPPKPVLEAVSAFIIETYLKPNPDSAYILGELAMLNRLMGNWEEAQRYALDAIQRDPYPLFFEELAAAQEALGDPLQAIETIEHALILNANDMHGCNRILLTSLIILSDKYGDERRSAAYRLALRHYAYQNDLNYISHWLQTI